MGSFSVREDILTIQGLVNSLSSLGFIHFNLVKPRQIAWCCPSSHAQQGHWLPVQSMLSPLKGARLDGLHFSAQNVSGRQFSLESVLGNWRETKVQTLGRPTPPRTSCHTLMRVWGEAACELTLFLMNSSTSLFLKPPSYSLCPCLFCSFKVSAARERTLMWFSYLKMVFES